jgi:GDP-L-fucose synthase
VREFIYVDDVAAGMIAALEHGEAGEVYNLGTDGSTAISIRELMQIIQYATGASDKPVTFSEKWDAGDDMRFTDSQKAFANLGWTHQVGIKDGIERTVKWYKSL